MVPPSVGTWFAVVDQGDIAAIRAAASECASLRDENGETALMRAVRSDNYDAVKVLLHNGSGFTNSDGLTALMIAAIVNKARCCRALVAKESHLILPDGRTPLMLAAQNGSLDAAKALMPYYVTKVDNRGRTALMYAAERGDLSIVEILHARECKFSSSEHETALSIAIMQHHHDVVEFLRSSEEDTMAMLSESARLNMSRRTDLDASLAPSNLLNHSTASQDSSTSDLIMSQADLSERLETTKAIALSELNTMNLELKTRIGKLHEDASELMSRNANLQTENKRLHERIQELLRHNQELKLELDDERRCHQDTVEQVKELTDMTQTLRDLQSNNILSESQADFGQRYGALELSIAPDPPGASTESLEKNDEIAALKMKIAALPTHDSSELSDKLAKEVEEKDRIIDDLKKQLSEQLNAYKALTATVEELRGQICPAGSQLSPLDETGMKLDEHLLTITRETHSQGPADPNVRIHELESKLQAQTNDTDKFLWTEEKENLTGLLTALSTEKDNLQDENDMLRDRAQMLEAEAEAREQEIKELRHQIHDQKSKLRELAEELDECKALNEDLQKSVSGEPAGDEGRVAALESRNKELSNRLATREAEIDALKNELTTQTELTKERISCLETDNAELRRRASHLEDIKSAYEQELEEFRERSLVAVADRTEHEEEVALFEAEVKNLHNVNRLQAHEIHALQREIDGLTSANNDLRASVSGTPSGDDTRVCALEERLSALQKEAAFKTQEIADLQKTVGELGDSSFLLERMKDEAAHREKEVIKLRDRLAARDQDVQDLEKECAEARARIRALEEVVSDTTNPDVSHLIATSQSRDKPLAVNVSEAEFLNLKDQLECLKTEKTELEYNLDKALLTIDSFEQTGDLDALRSQNERLREEADRLRDLLDTKEDDYPIAILEEKLKETKAQLDEANHKLIELQENVQSGPDTTYGRDFHELDQENIQAKLRIRTLEDAIACLHDQLGSNISNDKSSSEGQKPHDSLPAEQSNLITSLEDHIAKLQFELACVTEALEESQNKCDMYERQLDSLSSGNFSLSTKQAADSEADLQMLMQSNEYYSTQLKLKSDEVTSLQHQLNDLLSDHSPSLNEKLTFMQLALQRKDEDIALLRDEISELKAHIESSILPSTQDLEETLETRRALIQVLDNEIKDKRRGLKDLESQIEEIKARQPMDPNTDSLRRITELEDNLRLKELELQQLRDQTAEDNVLPLLALEPPTDTTILPNDRNIPEGEHQLLCKRVADLERDIKLLTETTIDRTEHEEEVALFEAEVKNLHNVNRLQAHEIHALQREIDGLTSANNDLRASVSGTPSGDDTRVCALEERLSALQKEAAFKTQEIADLQKTVGELGDSSFLLERMKDEAAHREKEVIKLRDRLAARDQDVQDLEKECAEARARIRALEEEVSSSQVQDLTAELEARTTEIDELRRLIDDNAADKKPDVDIEELRKDLVRVTAERDKLHDEVSKLNKTIGDLEQSLDAINAQASTSDANILRLNNEISFLKDQLSSKCLELEKANSKIDLLKTEAEEKTIESASSNPDLSSIPSLARSTSRSTQNLGELSLDELHELLDSERRRIKKLNNKITALMTEKNILTDQINAMKTSSAKNLPPSVAPVLEGPLATDINDVRISDLEQALKDANDRADAKERELTDALQRIKDLGAQISPLETEISSLQDKLSATGEIIEKLRTENQQLNKQIAADVQSEEIITSLTRELESLRQENSQLNAVKEDLKRQIEDKVKELAVERQQAETFRLSQRIPDKIVSECSDHVEKPRNVNESDDVMERADRCINFVAGMCVGASMVFGAQFLQTVIH
ncbi:Hypothetical protein GLP15_1881 [Giardia lamblia P15]|uniref:Uncharacterized protein n=1 Tax=Giardia intestinalis (strain P15) TaxID=658858 RepID=E1EVJ2_GIAIA|nr:Hypothetical protein GLP15_1881 [Giardia lamblia P15]